MSDKPPRKRLCQQSILSMFSKKVKTDKLEIDPVENIPEDIYEGPKSPSPETLCRNREPQPSSSKNQGEVMDSKRMHRSSLMADAAEKRIGSSVSNGKSTSPDMFDSSPESPEISWRGAPMDSLSTLSIDNPNVPPVIPAPDHKVLVQLPLPQEGISPRPFPSSYRDIWDDKHVRMPNSPSSLYPQNKMSEGLELVSRWSLICEAYKNPIKNVDDFLQAIISYNHRYKNKWKFYGLKALLQEEMCEEEQYHFFDFILPGIIDLALSLPKVVTTPPPLLQKQTNASITMSQKQIACLLANAFLCTFPRRNAKGNENEYASYPDINFNRLFFHKNRWALEKMKCIICYFKEIISKGRDGLITFSRQYVEFKETPRFEESNKPLRRLHINSKGLIEDASGLLQVDFANKYIGGGVLGLGCVQEEIRFVLCPELLITRLFTERLDKRDTLIVTGPEHFSRGVGYSSQFIWKGPYTDHTPRDSFSRKLCQVVALDALHFAKKSSSQYEPQVVMREIIKSYAGFQVLEGSRGTPVAIATGNWGCGAFNGDPCLKSLIQLASASEACRDVAYFTFEDSKLRDQIADMHHFLIEKGITVGELVMLLCQYGTRPRVDGKDLYHYIRYNISAEHSDTDSGNSPDSLIEGTPSENTPKKISDYFKPSLKCQVAGSSGCIKSNSPVHKHDTVVPSSSKRFLKEHEIQDLLDQCEKGLGADYTLDDLSLENEIDKDSKCTIRPSSQGQERETAQPHQSGGRLFSFLDEIDKNLK